MSLKKLQSFMKSVRWGDLATGDGKVVGVRPMAGWAWVGKELWTAAGRSQDKVKHLKKVPYAEYSFAKRSGEHVRIAGRCVVSQEKKHKEHLYQLLPGLKHYMDGPADRDYVVLRMRPTKIRWMKLTDYSYRKVKI